MALEIIREDIRTGYSAGREQTRTIIEENIIVPDTKPDISKVLLLDGDVFITEAQAQANKVAVEGVIRYKILYIADEEGSSVKGITTDTVFEHEIDIPGVMPGMDCDVRGSIEHIEFDVSNPRKLSLKTILNVNCAVRGERIYSLITDIDGIDDLQFLRSQHKVDAKIDASREVFTMSETLEIPAGKPSLSEILRTDVRLTRKEFNATENKVIVKGEITVNTLYMSSEEDRRIHYVEHELPFTHIIDLSGVSENSILRADCRITGSGFTEEEDMDGEIRLIRAQIDLEVFAEAFEEREIELISDTFSPTRSVELDRDELVTEEISADITGQELVKELIEVEAGSPPITEILNVMAVPVLSDYSVTKDRVNIEGVVNVSVLYLSELAEQPVCCSRRDIPFRKSVDVPGVTEGQECDINLDLGYCSFSMESSGKVDVRMTLGIGIITYGTERVSIIAEVEDRGETLTRSEPQPSVLIYFAQQGDSLWSIAKKYRVTVGDLEKANEMDSEAVINAGKQILIPRRIQY